MDIPQWAAFGAALGAAVGILMDNLVLTLGVSLLLGLVAALAASPSCDDLSSLAGPGKCQGEKVRVGGIGFDFASKSSGV